MKKMFTFAAMAAIAISASAQTESAFMDPVALLGEGATTTQVQVTTDIVLCKSASVTMTPAYDDNYKIVEMTAENDPSNSVTIDGVTYPMTTGIQGQTNPKINSITDGGPKSGAVFRFDVTKDGVLYVFGKLTGNKTYWAWEGDFANGQAGLVGYTLQGQLLGTTDVPGIKGTVVKYTLPGDDEFNWYTTGKGYDNGKVLCDASWCTAIAAGTPIDETVNLTNSFKEPWAAGNALGVIAFPVYAEAGTYTVHATGSKITCNGFVFIPGATEVSAVSFPDKGTAISNINADVENAKAPVKVVKNGQIMIGDFNIAGQRVK